MDVVKAFNTELSSIYEAKPPISKAKMTAITKSAIKGLKFYKHIVQSVEKFIQKCRPEYKVPGLYVIDSIVRQSRHQFGPDKEVFGPRFMKNINATFQQLYKCNEDDRSRIIRVLNLWQKNNVFPSNIVQPLMDMGIPGSSNDVLSGNEEGHSSRQKGSDMSPWKGWSQSNDDVPPENRTYAEMSTKNLEKFTKAEMTSAMESERATIYREPMIIKSENFDDSVKFNKKLLAFDYGDEDDEEEEIKHEDGHLSNKPNALALSMAQSLLSNPDLLRQLQQIHQPMQTEFNSHSDSLQPQHSVKIELEEPKYQQVLKSSPHQPPLPPDYKPIISEMEIKIETDQDDRMVSQPPLPPKDLDERSLAALMAPHRIIPPPVPYTDAAMSQYPPGFPTQPPLPMMDSMGMIAQFPPVLPPEQILLPSGQADGDERIMYNMPGEPPLPPQDFDERPLAAPAEERSSRRDRSRSRGRSGRRRSRSRSPRRKRSRSRSPHKSRSRSKQSERVKEKEREREKEHDRQRRGLPPIKEGCISVCSKTIWIGHVPKTCTETNIKEAFIPYGTVLSIDMIPPRGCAYVVMEKRQDGYRALKSTKKIRLLNSAVKMAWAPGKGVKGKEYKEYWEVSAGVSYIPISKIQGSQTLVLLEEGAFIDEESLPDFLKALRKSLSEIAAANQVPEVTAATLATMPTPTMVPPPNMMPPTSMNMPVLIHHPMQTQFGMPMPGLLPHQAMVMQVPMGIPPPNPLLMVQQQSLGGQALSLMGGLPSLVSRPVNHLAAAALQNLKNIKLPPDSTSMIPIPSSGDISKTDEDKAGRKSPSTQKLAQTISSSSVASTQAQFSAMLNATNSNCPIIPPTVSTSNAPIPFPPPNPRFFLPPGIRPGLGMPPGAQFPWMQKPPTAVFNEPNSNKSNSRSNAPSIPAFSGRPPFQDVANQLSSKDCADKQSNDMEISSVRNSPSHSDKMAISTDDESSRDPDFPRDDMSGMSRFPNSSDFSRMSMSMHRMRGPGGTMQGGRFPPMGSPFPHRMGGPRGMGMHSMHPGHRMEMDFLAGPHLPNNQQMERRDWYTRDFDGPLSFERDRRFQDDMGRDSWMPDALELDSRHRNQDNRYRGQEDSHHRQQEDDHKNQEDNRHGDRNLESDDYNECPRDWDRYDGSERQRYEQRPRQPTFHDDDIPRRKPPPKNARPTKALAEDLFRLRFYQRDKKPVVQSSLDRQLKQKDTIVEKLTEKLKKDAINVENKASNNQSIESNIHNNSCSNETKPVKESIPNPTAKDRESRKRSRWGRTLSEEREFQEQRRFEAELKFQSFEQSAQATKKLPSNTNISSTVTSSEAADSFMAVVTEPNLSNVQVVLAPSNTQPLTEIVLHSVKETLSPSLQETVSLPLQETVSLPLQETVSFPVQETAPLPVQETVSLSLQETVSLPIQEIVSLPIQETVSLPLQETVSLPVQEIAPSHIQETAPLPVQETVPLSLQETTLPPIQDAASEHVVCLSTVLNDASDLPPSKDSLSEVFESGSNNASSMLPESEFLENSTAKETVVYESISVPGDFSGPEVNNYSSDENILSRPKYTDLKDIPIFENEIMDEPIKNAENKVSGDISECSTNDIGLETES